MGAEVVDIESLQVLYRKSPVAQFFFDHAASRGKNQVETKVDSVLRLCKEEGIEASRREVVALFKEMDRAACGQFIIGRKGWPSRFHWKTSIIEVGHAVTGEDDHQIEVEEGREAGDERNGEIDDLIHTFFLRPGLRVQVELPEDLTQEEAARFSTFIQSLPFESDL